MARKNKKEAVEFNIENFDFEAVSGDIFGDSVTTAKLNPDLQGKIIAVYGANNTGKTTQCAKMVANSYLLPFEKGSNALGNKTQILRMNGWADAKKHVRTLTSNKTLLSALRAGIPIGVIVDGVDNMPVFAKQYICDNNNVEKFSKAGAHGSQWEEYQNEIFWFVTKLTQAGFTLFFIGHPYESKDEDGYLDLIDDKRTAKPIKDVCDFVFFLESNGVDPETGKVIPSTAFLAEHKPTEDSYGFFARSRFPYVQTVFEEWNAEVVRQAIYDGIVEQAEIEGSELVNFEEVVEKYESSFDLSYEEAMEAIYNMLDECDEKELTTEADDILLGYVDNPDDIKDLTRRQLQTIQGIYDELTELLKEHADKE